MYDYVIILYVLHIRFDQYSKLPSSFWKIIRWDQFSMFWKNDYYGINIDLHSHESNILAQ